MSRPSNQAIERHYFDQFRSHYPLPNGTIIYTDKPDVIVRGTRILGVEIACLYLVSGADPSSEQVQRQRRLEVLKLAQKVHLARGGKKIELSVDFSPVHSILNIRSLAHALADIATKAELNPTVQLTRKDYDHVPEVRFAHYNRREYSDAKWKSTQVYEVPELSSPRLRDLVAEKTRKHLKYQVCDEYWLLIVVDVMDPAQEQGIVWPAGETLERSPFERV